MQALEGRRVQRASRAEMMRSGEVLPRGACFPRCRRSAGALSGPPSSSIFGRAAARAASAAWHEAGWAATGLGVRCTCTRRLPAVVPAPLPSSVHSHVVDSVRGRLCGTTSRHSVRPSALPRSAEFLIVGCGAFSHRASLRCTVLSIVALVRELRKRAMFLLVQMPARACIWCNVGVVLCGVGLHRLLSVLDSHR